MATQAMQTELDELLTAYKTAVEGWIVAIRAEEDFAKPDHSVKAWGSGIRRD